MSDLGIYIHVPFCGKKCGYCDFFSVSYRKEKADAYTEAVCRNIRSYGDSAISVDTVYFGGGTPSLLTPAQLEQILLEIRGCFQLSDACEITLEANPGTVSEKKLAELRKTGINRLSLGVQSLNDNELRLLGRTHSAERAVKAVKDAVNAGFENISCDLMLALPGQSEEDLLRSVDRLAELPIQHVSAYILSIEEGTAFDCQDIRSRLPDDDETAGLYIAMTERLREKGFRQYEVSNFAKEGYESRHNCRYWKCLDYLGIGPSAHSCFGGKRFAAAADTELFISSPVQPVEITDDCPCGFIEYSMLRLRLAEGLSLSDIEDRFSPEKRLSVEKKIAPLAEAGYLKFDGDRLALTPKGFLVSNSVIIDLLGI
ncbi:MAG: radical SAM family heme chaperone HemW [Ruminococcus sp.]|nr:radical SAM family heme chaperone HemW [Ruminococcus sp.]